MNQVRITQKRVRMSCKRLRHRFETVKKQCTNRLIHPFRIVFLPDSGFGIQTVKNRWRNGFEPEMHAFRHLAGSTRPPPDFYTV